jgi:hypothetical protein
MVPAALFVPVASKRLARPSRVLLRFRPKVGDVQRMRAEISAAGTMTLLGETKPARVSGSFPFTQTVKSVNRPDEPAGPGKEEFEVVLSFGEGQITYTFGDETLKEKVTLPDLTFRLTPFGEVLGAKGWQAPRADGPFDRLRVTPSGVEGRATQIGVLISQLSGSLGLLTFSKNAVAPGDTWTSEATAPTGSKAQLRSVFEGFQEMNGVDCARIRSNLEVPFEQKLPPDAIGTRVELRGSDKLEMLTWMAYEEGKVVRQQVDLKLSAESKTYLQGVEEPQVGRTQMSARLMVQPASPPGADQAGQG